eukprot:SAG22_NODE_116_length_19306_cov_247.696517_12_plen_185_part_00
MGQQSSSSSPRTTAAEAGSRSRSSPALSSALRCMALHRVASHRVERHCLRWKCSGNTRQRQCLAWHCIALHGVASRGGGGTKRRDRQTADGSQIWQPQEVLGVVPEETVPASVGGRNGGGQRDREGGRVVASRTAAAVDRAVAVGVELIDRQTARKGTALDSTVRVEARGKAVPYISPPQRSAP